MGWSDWFWTKDPETGKQTQAKVKTDETGAVTDMLTDLQDDSAGGRHGHVWGLGPYTHDSDIGGRASSSERSRSGESRDRGREDR